MSKALCHGLEVLKFLSSRRSVGVTEVADFIKVNKSTAFRILQTLQVYNMAEQDLKTNRYKLGPAILMMADQFSKNAHIMGIAKPFMLEFVAETKMSCHLCMLSNDEVVMIEQFEGKYTFSNNSRVGIREPLHASSVGKCLVAFSAEEKREKIVKNHKYDIYNEKTIKNSQEFKLEIEKIRKQGFAVDNFEISDNVRCVAVPILDKTGVAKYSMGVSGTITRMTDERLAQLTSELKRISKSIEDAIKSYH